MTTRERFVHPDLGQLKRGDRVEFTLRGNAADVMLLDSTNFTAYKSGRRYRAEGGMTKKSPVVLEVPRTGRWHGVVDVRGLGGQVRATIRLLPRPLPPLRQTTSRRPSTISQTPTPASDGAAVERPVHDVFISHASEDKDGVVRQLAQELDDLGLSVWYDEFTLKVGDSLRRNIDAGLATCRYGVVVVSRSFFAKNWPQYELDGLVTREMADGAKLILPVWHDVTKDEVIASSPTLADKVALRTADLTVREIAEQIVAVVNG